jgi:transcriptional regulator with XRE-family HTH domain
MPLSETIRRLRFEHAWSRRELARRAGLSHQTIVNLERGDSVPALATLGKLARAFDVPPSALVSFEELEQLSREKETAAA